MIVFHCTVAENARSPLLFTTLSLTKRSSILTIISLRVHFIKRPDLKVPSLEQEIHIQVKLVSYVFHDVRAYFVVVLLQMILYFLHR